MARGPRRKAHEVMRDDYGGRRPTDAELAQRFMLHGGFTEVQAWVAVRFIRGDRRGRGRRVSSDRRALRAA